MADPDFETNLMKMFADAPAMGDSEAFARRVEGRLDRGWQMRQALIWTFGLAGGAIGVTQMFTSRMLVQLSAVSEESTRMLDGGLSSISNLQRTLDTLPLGGEVVWMAAALGVMALAFAITRAVEEF